MVNLSELEGTHRLDGEFYQVDYLKVRDKLGDTSTKTIQQLSKNVLSFGAYSQCNFITWQESGIPYLKAENILDGYIDFSEIMFIDEDAHSLLKKSQVLEGQVLFSMSGTIGNAAVAHNIPQKLNSNQDIAKITLRPKNSPYYLAAFINSRYGKLQVQREIVGSVQQHIFLWQTKKLKVPIVSKELEDRIEIVYKEALDKFEISASFYRQAEGLLFQELKLEAVNLQSTLSYTSTLSKAFGRQRIDAEYFQPLYERTEKHLVEEFNSKPIGKIKFIDVTTGQYSDKYVDKSEGNPFIRGTNIKRGTIDMDDLVFISPSDQIESKKAMEGDIVVTRVGSIGLSARIPRELEGGTISDNLIRLRFDQTKLNSYYLALLMGSPICVSLMKRNSRGSVQQRLNQETLKDIVVPILSNKSQLKIASLVEQSNAAQLNAKLLLDKTKRAVEISIDKNENEALTYLG